MKMDWRSAEDDHVQPNLVSLVSIIEGFTGEEDACRIDILKK